MLCNVTEMAALVAVRRGATAIAEADIFQALEDSFYKRGNKDADSRELGGDGEGTDAASMGGDADDDEGTRVPASLSRAICVYEAGRALVGSMLPEYEELAKVVACPDGAPTGFAHFVPKEEHLETGIMTRGYCESLMVSRLAGRAAERLALGDGGITTAGGGDLLAATTIARELLLRAGLSRAVGPLSCMDTEQVYGRRRGAARSVGRFGSATASAASAEIEALLRAAEAKVREFFFSIFFSFLLLEVRKKKKLTFFFLPFLSFSLPIPSPQTPPPPGRLRHRAQLGRLRRPRHRPARARRAHGGRGPVPHGRARRGPVCRPLLRRLRLGRGRGARVAREEGGARARARGRRLGEECRAARRVRGAPAPEEEGPRGGSSSVVVPGSGGGEQRSESQPFLPAGQGRGHARVWGEACGVPFRGHSFAVKCVFVPFLSFRGGVCVVSFLERVCKFGRKEEEGRK